MICTYVSEISEIVVKLKNKTMQNVCHEQEHKKRVEECWFIMRRWGGERQNQEGMTTAELHKENSENFWAYLPQSLSDNILVSHKSQALQHHSKRHRVRQRTHKEMGNSEHDRTAQVRLAQRRSRTVQNTHTRHKTWQTERRKISLSHRCISAKQRLNCIKNTLDPHSDSVRRRASRWQSVLR